MIGSSHRRRARSPLGTVLIINLLGKGFTPRACMGDGGCLMGSWHWRALALLRNIQNIRICMGKKTYCFCNLRKWKDFNKKQLTLLKMCVTSLLCGPRADLWPFYGFLCKRFSLYIKVSTCSLCTDVPTPSEKNREKRLYGKERCVTTLKTAV